MITVSSASYRYYLHISAGTSFHVTVSLAEMERELTVERTRILACRDMG